MSTNKHIDRICCVILAITLVFSIFSIGIGAFDNIALVSLNYENRLFDDSRVHTINIIMDDWDSFVSECENEEYTACDVEIDGEKTTNVGIRAKGNTSLSSVKKYGNNRYSLKIEFDKYENKSYYGLDKLSLNNLIQDNTYMKDYTVYTLMREFGVAAPLCSFAQVQVNGEDFGVYLAVEAVEESFLQRNYGEEYGELYKPDNMSMGGGKGNGKDFSQNDEEIFKNKDTQQNENNSENDSETKRPNNKTSSTESNVKQDFNKQSFPDMGQQGGFGGHGGMNKSSNDALLQYTDDDFDSYQNIFDNAKTNVTNADKNRLINSLKALNEGENMDSCVDIEAVIKYFVVHNFVLNFDSYTGQMIHNYYLYESEGKLTMLPWDYNLAFGGFMSMGGAQSLVNYPLDNPVSGSDISSRPMISWIFENEEYKALYHSYMSEFLTKCFDSGYFETKLQSVYNMLVPYVRSEKNAFCTFDEFKKGAETLKEFCLLRAESLSGQLDGTIPSTSQGQSEDSSSLVKAENININDMGSMGMGGGFRDDFSASFEADSSSEGDSDNSSGEDSAGNSQAPPEFDGESPELFEGSIPDAFGNSGPPEMPNGEMPDFENGERPEMPDGGVPNFGGGERPILPDGAFVKNNTQQ